MILSVCCQVRMVCSVAHSQVCWHSTHHRFRPAVVLPVSFLVHLAHQGRQFHGVWRSARWNVISYSVEAMPCSSKVWSISAARAGPVSWPVW